MFLQTYKNHNTCNGNGWVGKTIIFSFGFMRFTFAYSWKRGTGDDGARISMLESLK